jgi:hypothetical protein
VRCKIEENFWNERSKSFIYYLPKEGGEYVGIVLNQGVVRRRYMTLVSDYVEEEARGKAAEM